MGRSMATTSLNYNYDRPKNYFGANKEVSFYLEKFLEPYRKYVKNSNKAYIPAEPIIMRNHAQSELSSL